MRAVCVRLFAEDTRAWAGTLKSSSAVIATSGPTRIVSSGHIRTPRCTRHEF